MEFFRRSYNTLRNLLGSLLGKVLILSVCFIIVGTFGFYFLENPHPEQDLSLWQCLYWTIITITTIGFGDISPKTMGGQSLAIFLAFFGVALISLTFATIMELVIETTFFKRRKFLKLVRKMDEVTLICGFNERIRILIEELSTEGIKIVLVDKEPVPEDWDAKWGAYIQGDPTEDATLLKAGVEKAKKALVSLDDDGNALLAMLTIQSLCKDCYTIAEVVSKENIQHFRRINCNQIICQEEILGKFLNITLLLPELSPAYNELISMEGNEIYCVEKIDDYVDKTFEETIRLVKKKYDALLIGYVRGDNAILNPAFSETIRKKDVLLVISETFVE